MDREQRVSHHHMKLLRLQAPETPPDQHRRRGQKYLFETLELLGSDLLEPLWHRTAVEGATSQDGLE